MSNPFPRYRILESLGRGGMGEVFLADDHQLERKVAIKFLPDDCRTIRSPGGGSSGRRSRRRRSTIRSSARFTSSPRSMAGRASSWSMSPGQTLETRLASGPLAPAEAIQIAAEVAEALEQAHARRILHRDLKPSNLMLTPEGHVKVMDFGLAKRVQVEDPGAHGYALWASAYNHWFSMRRREQADTALRAAELLRSTDDLWNLADALTLFQMASVFQGRLDGVAQFEEETETLTQRQRQHGSCAVRSDCPRSAGLVHRGGSRPVRGSGAPLREDLRPGGHAVGCVL